LFFGHAPHVPLYSRLNMNMVKVCR